MALRFKLCTFLIGLAHIIPTTFGFRLWGVDVHYHKQGLTPEEMQKIVEHNQKNHQNIMADNTPAHQNQTITLQKHINNLVIDFITQHQNATRELLAGHENDRAHNRERDRKWMEDFRKASIDAQELYNKMINFQLESHGNMTQDFVIQIQKLQNSNEILKGAINNFKSDGKLLYFGGVGVGVLFLMAVVGIVWKGLCGKCGNKVERYQSNMFAAHPSTYPPTYGRPGYEMVPMVRTDLEANRK